MFEQSIDRFFRRNSDVRPCHDLVAIGAGQQDVLEDGGSYKSVRHAFNERVNLFY